MCLWSVHPKYLDKYGLISLWREALLIQKNLTGELSSFKSGVEYYRFKSTQNPLLTIGAYLSFIASEGCRRGYKFNHEKIIFPNFEENQLDLEWAELQAQKISLTSKLRERDIKKYREIAKLHKIEKNPVFYLSM